jgi:hypothetical protein
MPCRAGNTPDADGGELLLVHMCNPPDETACWFQEDRGMLAKHKVQCVTQNLGYPGQVPHCKAAASFAQLVQGAQVPQVQLSIM